MEGLRLTKGSELEIFLQLATTEVGRWARRGSGLVGIRQKGMRVTRKQEGGGTKEAEEIKRKTREKMSQSGKGVC